MDRGTNRKYKYTYNNNNLTEEQKKFYEENGFLMVRNLISHDLLDECKQRFLDICDEKVDKGGMIVMKDYSLRHSGIKGERLINKIQDILHDDVLFQYPTQKSILHYVEGIIGPNITAFHSMLINKPPDSEKDSSRHPLHQDMHYFPFRPFESVVAAWTAMERVDETNGCLFGVPGTHKGELFKHDYPKGVNNKAYHGVLGMEHLPVTNFVMEKGDTVFFHPVLLHGSGPNLTKGFRKAISCHYANSNCDFVDVMGTTQENIALEIEGMSERRGFKIPFHYTWITKSRYVQGTPGRFQRMEKELEQIMKIRSRLIQGPPGSFQDVDLKSSL